MTTESAFVGVVERMRRDTADRNPASREQHERAKAVLPGGTTRTILHHAPFPLTFVSGDAGNLTDADGHTYVDLVGDYTAGLLGHSEKRVHAAVADALAGNTSVGGVHPAEIRFAELVCNRFGHQRVRFTNSGTEANLMAITLLEDRHRSFDHHGHVRRLSRRGLLLLARQRAVERAVPHHRRPVQRPRRVAKR